MLSRLTLLQPPCVRWKFFSVRRRASQDGTSSCAEHSGSRGSLGGITRSVVGGPRGGSASAKARMTDRRSPKAQSSMATRASNAPASQTGGILEMRDRPKRRGATASLMTSTEIERVRGPPRHTPARAALVRRKASRRRLPKRGVAHPGESDCAKPRRPSGNEKHGQWTTPPQKSGAGTRTRRDDGRRRFSPEPGDLRTLRKRTPMPIDTQEPQRHARK